MITADHVHTELGELVAGTKPGRSTPGQITVYKSVGVAVQDAAAVALVLYAAHQQDSASRSPSESAGTARRPPTADTKIDPQIWTISRARQRSGTTARVVAGA